MSENTIHTYEGLFLFPQSAGANLGEAAEHVQGLLGKVDAEVLSFGKWDERRLAYEIKGNKRGIFFLSYFKVAGDQMATLERQCLLSEDLLRFMLTRADQVDLELIETSEGREALQAEIAQRAKQTEEGTSEVGVRATTKAQREATEAAPKAAPETAPSATAEAADSTPKADAPAATATEETPAEDAPAAEAPATDEAPAAEAPSEDATESEAAEATTEA